MVRIGLQGYAEACMVLSEAALFTGFMGWQRAGLGEAIAARWVSGGNPKARAGGQRHGRGAQIFFNDVGRISEEVYDIHNNGAYSASPASLLGACAPISGSNRRTANATAPQRQAVVGPPKTPNPLGAMAPTYTPIEKVCKWCATVCKCHVAHAPSVNGYKRSG